GPRARRSGAIAVRCGLSRRVLGAAPVTMRGPRYATLGGPFDASQRRRFMAVMVTGGAGYIGSHAARRLLEDGRRVVIVDNLSCGVMGAVNALRSLPQGTPDNLVFIECDIADRPRVERAIREHEVDSVLHFAAFADLRESVFSPLKYHANNTGAAIEFL